MGHHISELSFVYHLNCTVESSGEEKSRVVSVISNCNELESGRDSVEDLISALEEL